MLSTALGTLLFLALCAGLFSPLEAWSRATANARAVATCAGLLVANTLLMELLGGPALDALAQQMPSLGPPSLPRVLAVVLLSDLLGYGAHRAMHRFPVLWRFHAVHHSPAQLTWVEAWRQHPVDALLHGLAVGLPGALLSASLSDFASVVLVRKAFTSFLHLAVPVGFGRFSLWLASPAFHHLHHDARLQPCNFAGTFPFIDRLLGTYRAPTPLARSSPASPAATSPRSPALSPS
jgi:sterol desaturase/sphingolipid hydroxylase (fatty acid hydroxylase superfamily)